MKTQEVCLGGDRVAWCGACLDAVSQGGVKCSNDTYKFRV